MANIVNDVPLVSMVKYTDQPKVWSDGLRKKYEIDVTQVVFFPHSDN